MKGVEFLILRFGLFFLFEIVTSPVAIVACLMMAYLDGHERVRMLRWILAPVLLAWLFGLPWLTSQTAQHMAFEDQKFGAAVKLTYYDLRLRLAFLPVIGHWFAPRTDERDTDEDDA